MPFLPDLLESVVISDRQKGLKNAVVRHLLTAIHGHCCQHIADNIARRFSIMCIKLFWRAARAKTKPAFDTIMEQLATEHPKCATYLKKIRPESWTYWAFPTRRWLHDTSNVSESVNSTWLEARSLPALYLLYWLWRWTMTTIYKRRRKP